MLANYTEANNIDDSSHHLVSISNAHKVNKTEEQGNRKSASSSFHYCLHDKVQPTQVKLPIAKISVLSKEANHSQYVQ